MYIYTTADDGSHPEVLTRIKMTSSAFVCNPPPATIVEYILFGTMQVSVGSFVLQYAGYNAVIPTGCSASLVFTFPQNILAANPTLSIVPVVSGSLLSTTPSVITTNTGSPAALVTVVNNPAHGSGATGAITVVPAPKGKQTAKGEVTSGTQIPGAVVNTSPAANMGKGKQRFLRVTS